MTKFNAILRLRRDNDYNYKKIENTFIPANGEICLVDTAKGGLQAVCGDGITPFKNLEFLNQLVIKGYFIENNFYKDKEKLNLCSPLINVIYLDLLTNKIYYYNGETYALIGSPNLARATEAGIMKLYHTTGTNEDGTMTQKVITEELEKIDKSHQTIINELDDKVEIALNVNEETLIFMQE